MRTPESVYRGLVTEAGQFWVTVDGTTLTPRRRMPQHGLVHGFAWGGSGAGAKQLAHALVLDATGDADLAAASHVWLMWAVVVNWPRAWRITAAEVAKWVEQWRREARSARLARLYDWAAAPADWSPPHVVRATGTDPAVPPAVPPAPPWSQPAGRVRLYPEPLPDAPEGGGV